MNVFLKSSLKFLKIPPALHNHRIPPRHYNRNRFHEKNIHEITILQRHLVRFHGFPKSQYVIRNLFWNNVWKMVWNTFANFFSNFFQNQHIYNTHLDKISIYRYPCNFKIYVIFKLHRKCNFLKKFHRVNPIEILWFLPIFEENR